MPRLARLDAPGVLHHVIGRAIKRRKIFLNTIDRNDFIARLRQLAEDRSMAVYAWALLPNHLYRKPLLRPNEVAKLLSVTHQTASSLIRNFEELNILKKWEKIGRSQLYVFGRYLALFMD